jgi:hypothetical protein
MNTTILAADLQDQFGYLPPHQFTLYGGKTLKNTQNCFG